MRHVAFSFQLPFIMLINGETFEGTYEYECPYFIHEIRRVGRGVVFRFDYLGGLAYRLPEQYAKAVSDADMRAVNSYKILYAVVKRERDDGTGVAELVIK